MFDLSIFCRSVLIKLDSDAFIWIPFRPSKFLSLGTVLSICRKLHYFSRIIAGAALNTDWVFIRKGNGSDWGKEESWMIIARCQRVVQRFFHPGVLYYVKWFWVSATFLRFLSLFHTFISLLSSEGFIGATNLLTACSSSYKETASSPHLGFLLLHSYRYSSKALIQLKMFLLSNHWCSMN